MMYLRRLIVLFFLVILSGMPVQLLHADLGDLSKSVTEDQADGPDEQDEEEDDAEDEVDPETRGLWDALFAITGLLWYYHNASSWYPPYPYGGEYGDPSYVGHNLNLLLTETGGKDLKRNRLIVQSSGGGFLQGNDPGWTITAGASWMIASVIEPEIEYRLWNDKSGFLHQLRGGANIPMVQSDYFSLALNMGGVFFLDAFRLDGFAIGGVVTSFPAAPFSLEIRGGGILSSSANLGEFGLRLGWHIGRTRVFAGYYGLFHDNIALNAIELGAGLYF